jgi:hypothetical protein
VHGISATAREKIEAAGGTVVLLREPKVKKTKHHKGKPAPAPAAATAAAASDEPAADPPADADTEA